MTSNRSRYSTAPTYGMQKRPAPKKQAVPTGPAYPPAQPTPNAPFVQPGMPGQGQQAMPSYPPQQAWQQQPPQMAQQQTYAMPRAGYVQQSEFNPRQPVYQAPVRQPSPANVQPLPYHPQQPYQQQPIPQEYAIHPKAKGGDQWLQILMLAVLPALFLLTLFVSASILKIAFVVLGVVSLIAMWMQKAFVPSARATLTLVYGALMLVCVVSLISAPRDTTTAARGANGQSAAVGQQNQPASSAGALNMGINDVNNHTPVPSSTPEPESGINSAAWKSLSQFFDYWNANNIDYMLNLVSPTWKAAQDQAKTSLFFILANRKPEEYTFEKISGSETDLTRTITMTAVIDRQNSRPKVKIRFQVVMVKVNSEWYVDPASLSSNNVEVDETAENADTAAAGGNEQGTSPAEVTQKPTATPAPKSKLYHNANGGKYYHADAECPSVDKAYLPLTSFYYRDLNTTKFKNLLPCTKCNAPSRN